MTDKKHSFAHGPSYRRLRLAMLAAILLGAPTSHVLAQKVTSPTINGVYAGSADDAFVNFAVDAPDMMANVYPKEHGSTLTVIGDDAKPFTINRIVLNERESYVDCDLPKYGRDPKAPPVKGEAPSMEAMYGTKLPVTLKRGAQAVVVSDCGEILSADIQTDRGRVRYKFAPSAKPKGKGAGDD